MGLEGVLEVQEAIAQQLPNLIEHEMRRTVESGVRERTQALDEREAQLQAKAQEMQAQHQALLLAQQQMQGLTVGSTEPAGTTTTRPPSRLPRPVSRMAGVTGTTSGPPPGPTGAQGEVVEEVVVPEPVTLSTPGPTTTPRGDGTGGTPARGGARGGSMRGTPGGRGGGSVRGPRGGGRGGLSTPRPRFNPY